MLLTELLSGATDAPPKLRVDPEIVGLSADSRTVEPGFLFAALAGSQADGADFVDDAINRGAVAILGDERLSLGADAPAIVINAANPRRRFAEIAARFYARQPSIIVAVTGTNGKTSVAYFARQIWQELGYRSGTIGTLGAQWRGHVQTLPTTTPEPVSLHRLLDQFTLDEVDCVAIEASSHGLHQHRLDGVKIGCAGFTNLSHDHLDYHESPDSYLAAKLRLFSELLPEGGAAVLNADAPQFNALSDACGARGHRVLSYGVAGRDVRIERCEVDADGQSLGLVVGDSNYDVTLPLIGQFQVHNALCALGLVLASGGDEEKSVAALATLSVVPGRLEKVAEHPSGAPVFVDYAHTPDALAHALGALRTITKRQLVVVFGAGGDRDPHKRSAMGEAAMRHADRAVVTDDNPRGEDPAAIRRTILEACPGATEISDRQEAIVAALSTLTEGDVLLVAGKGHERGQTVGPDVLPFDDSEVVRRAVNDLGGGRS